MDVMIKQISRLSPDAGGAFNFLHLRVEEDWVRHCQQWEAIQDGIVRDNCLRNTDTIDVMLGLFRLRKTAPLFVASYWADVDRTSPHVQGLSRIVQTGYQV